MTTERRGEPAPVVAPAATASRARSGTRSPAPADAASRARVGGEPRTWAGAARIGWFAAAGAAVVVSALAGLAFGPVRISPVGIAAELLGAFPGVNLHSGLSEREAAIVTQLRLPRVVLSLLVGAVLALAGGCYQGVFRNPLADPYLLGVAAGAGLGATVAITSGPAVPLGAFVGALVAVGITYLLGATSGGVRTPVTLILAGVAVSTFFAAAQTFLLQRHADTIREVYSWLLGRLATSGWHETLVLAPYAVIMAVVVLAHRRELDVLALGDDEATSLGLNPRRSRLVLIVAASLGTAAAVAVSGLIGFVGIIVPHAVRLLVGASYRAILPLSMLFGAAFLALADLAARTLLTPDEIPIGVVTAFLGAPFFAVVLRTARRELQ